MSIHSIQIDQSMQNWQVSGGSAYWFRCIPNRSGCIATFLISKAPRLVFMRRTLFLHENGIGIGGSRSGSIVSIVSIGGIGSSPRLLYPEGR